MAIHPQGATFLNDNEICQRFFNKYHMADIMRGYELAQDPDLFNIARRYRDTDIRLLLKFVEDDALGFFEALRELRGSDVIELREATHTSTRDATNNPALTPSFAFGSHPHRYSNASRDSGYASRPSSEVEGFLTSTLDQPCKNNSSSCTLLQDDALPANMSLSMEFSPQMYQPAAEPREHCSSGVCAPQSPFSFAGESVAPSPAASRSNAPRLFECTYCGQDFARYGFCLNHEMSYHNQHKKWICPHCDIPFNTKAGYDRHHRGHDCQKCKEPERVEVLSDLKTACACPYCGALFQGTSCFAIRADHIKSTHYKGERRRTRADMDYSQMIEALLRRKDLSLPWTDLLKTKPKIKLSWTPEKARELVDDLEFGEYANGIQDLLQRVYDFADKLELPSDASFYNATTTEGEADQVSTTMASAQQIRSPKNSLTTDVDKMAFDADPEDVFMNYDEASDGPMRFLDDRFMSTAQRTKDILAQPLTGRRPIDNDLSTTASHLTGREKSQYLPADLRENVFMGYGKDTLEPMELTQDVLESYPALTRQSPTPPSQSWAFGELDGPLRHMEDIMMQQNLAYSAAQASADAAAYTPPAWEDSLPPSLRSAAVNTVPPSRPLPTRPQHHIPRCSTLRH